MLIGAEIGSRLHRTGVDTPMRAGEVNPGFPGDVGRPGPSNAASTGERIRLLHGLPNMETVPVAARARSSGRVFGRTAP